MLQRTADSPMFSKTDAQRILARAAEIEGSDDTGPLTADELRSIAGEAGFGRQAVERAITEARQTGAPDVHRNPVNRSGLVITRLSTIRTIPIELTSDQLIRVVRLFQPYRDGQAKVGLAEHQITWRDQKGIRFAVESTGGITQIRVFLSRPILLRGRWMGWENEAANRLETLVFLVADREPPEE